MPVSSYLFGEFQLDCERFELRRKGIPLRLERQPMELLILLASSGGRLVTRPEIARRLWDTEVFVDTEHGINTAIRKIRHALREDPENPRFLQTVTGKGYRFVGVAPEPQPAPPPAPPDQPSQPTQPEPPVHQPVVPTRTSSRIWLTGSIAAVLAILIGIATFGARSVRGHTAKPAITSIAVLPLDNLSGDPTQDYLADGMTDELTTMLAKSSTLRVISRTSVMQYKGAHRPLPEIARQLNVDGILEGSLARSGDNLHMTVQLIHAPTDTHLWAESYDRNANDLVSLPHDAALTIAQETHSAVGSQPPQKYVSPAAHDAYLRGHFLWFAGQDEASGQYFLKATQLQPDYALAWAGLSSYYGAGAVDFKLDPRTALPLSVAAAHKSIELDPSLPEAHLVVAAGEYWLNDWNLPAAMNELDHAVDLDPRYAEAWHLRSKILIQLNRYQEGIEEQRRAMEITPFERPWGMAYAYLMTRNFDAAIDDAKARIEAHPDPITWWVLSEAYQGKGMDKESEQALERALLLWNNQSDLESVRRAFARGGRTAVLRYYIDHYKAQSQKGYESPYHFASLYAQLGDKQQALAYLDECIRQHAPPILDIQNDAAFDSLHSDPHYRAIVQKIGLPPAW
jgi:TolB-like protein/DNA-binding winged helix-turn-helix (wHTH) protein/tetratricopeptide (TPR) repeat protein